MLHDIRHAGMILVVAMQNAPKRGLIGSESIQDHARVGRNGRDFDRFFATVTSDVSAHEVTIMFAICGFRARHGEKRDVDEIILSAEYSRLHPLPLPFYKRHRHLS